MQLPRGHCTALRSPVLVGGEPQCQGRGEQPPLLTSLSPPRGPSMGRSTKESTPESRADLCFPRLPWSPEGASGHRKVVRYHMYGEGFCSILPGILGMPEKETDSIPLRSLEASLIYGRFRNSWIQMFKAAVEAPPSFSFTRTGSVCSPPEPLLPGPLQRRAFLGWCNRGPRSWSPWH